MRTRHASSSTSSSSPSRPPSLSPPPQTFSESLMAENLETAEALVAKWEDHPSRCNISSFFRDNRFEAKEYLHAVKSLQSAMHRFIAGNSSSEQLIRAQKIMKLAMKRLQKEFYQILKSNRAYLDTESFSSHSSRTSISDESEDEEGSVPNDAVSEVEKVCMVAMDDLKAIAECMIFCGYGKECVNIYKIVRKSIVDEVLYNWGVEKLGFSQVQKMDWEVLEPKIKNWLHAMKFAVKRLFYRERILCDHVFATSSSIIETCFAETTRDGALTLFRFPEMVGRCKKTPEKMFRTLDLYEVIATNWPEIEFIFSFESTSAVRSLAWNSLVRLADAVRTMLVDFEMAIQNDAPKAPFPGGGVHPLTRYVMNYISFLADYSEILADIVADWPLNQQTALPESYFDSSESPISVRIAWLILILLCKLDGKAELYRDAATSYFFLANNIQYVVAKVRNSNLKQLLGDEWVMNHETKVRQYAGNFERMSWSKVMSSIPEDSAADISLEEVKERFAWFNSAFEEAYRKQSSLVVSDAKLRDEIKISVSRMLVPAYRQFYEKYRHLMRRNSGSQSIVRFSPEDLDNYLSDLFYGTGGPGSVSSSSASTSSSPARSSRR